MYNGFTASWHQKIPKDPRPQRCLAMFTAVEAGLRDCIALTQSDLALLKCTLDDDLSGVNQAAQCKTAERYLKRLEFQLVKVEELRDQYEIHLKMKEGARSMATAYAATTVGRQKALNSVRTSFRECNTVLLSIEQKLERYLLGSWALQLQCIQGYARLCPGDQFELELLCGAKQRWRSRCRVEKDGAQNFTCPNALLRPLLDEPLLLRAYEVKRLGRDRLLGVKRCDTEPLFAVRPQLMTINLNSIGTLKLNLVVTWNPLHGCMDDSTATISLRGEGSKLTKSMSFSLAGGSMAGLAGSKLTKSKSFNLSTSSLAWSPGKGERPRPLSLMDGGKLLDVEYYSHVGGGLCRPTSELNLSPSRQSCVIQPLPPPPPQRTSCVPLNYRHSSYHPRSLSPIPSPVPQGSDEHAEQEEEEEEQQQQQQSSNNNNNHHHHQSLQQRQDTPQQQQQQQQQQHQHQEQLELSSSSPCVKPCCQAHASTTGCTPTSTCNSSGSRSSSLHLTGTITSSGFGSSGSNSSYCDSTSVPNSTLTSPESEVAPVSKQTSQSQVHNNNNNSRQSSCKLTTVPITPSTKGTIVTSTPKQCDVPRSKSASITNLTSKLESKLLNMSLKQQQHQLQQQQHQQQQQQSSSFNKAKRPSQELIVVEATVHQQQDDAHSSHNKNNSNVSEVVPNMPRSVSYPLAIPKQPEDNYSYIAGNVNGKKKMSTFFGDNHHPDHHDHHHGRHHATDAHAEKQASIYEEDVDDEEEEDVMFVSGQNLINSHLMHVADQDQLDAHMYFNVDDTIFSLISSLEDIQGQYSELHALQQNVMELFRTLNHISKLRGLISQLSDFSVQNLTNHMSKSKQKNCASNGKHGVHAQKKNTGNKTGDGHQRRDSLTSNISVSVESALECFDFLDSAITDSEVDSNCSPAQNRQRVLKADYDSNSASPSQSTTISTPSPLQNNNNNNNSSSKSVVRHSLCTGCEQLDIALMSHLTYCQRLLENLGAFGPLRGREQSSLERLQTQAHAIHYLQMLCTNLRDHLQKCYELKCSDVSSSSSSSMVLQQQQQQQQLIAAYHERQQLLLQSVYTPDERIRLLWDVVCCQHLDNNNTDRNVHSELDWYRGTLVCVTSGGFAQCLASFLRQYNVDVALSSRHVMKVCQLITKRIIDAPHFEIDYVVTIFQLSLYLTSENCSFDHLFRMYAHEVQLIDALQCGDPVVLKQTLNKFKRTLPSKEPLHNIMLLLLDADQLIIRIVETYFLEISKNKSMRSAVLAHCLDALENDSPQLRQTACMVLMLLNGSECLQQLGYISYADTAASVREQARQTLLSCGPHGRKIYEESQLFANGFQGLSVSQTQPL